MQYNVERAKEALNQLVESPYYAQTWRKIVAAAKKPDAEPFTGDQETLNELVHIGRQNTKALDNLLDVLKHKRRDKTDYQREFMAAKRRRDAKAIRLEQIVSGNHMTLEERRLFLLKRYTDWHKERDAVLAQYPDVSWEERNSIIRQFWVRQEALLDAALADLC
jgi:hypothetical protein